MELEGFFLPVVILAKKITLSFSLCSVVYGILLIFSDQQCESVFPSELEGIVEWFQTLILFILLV